MSYVSSKDRPLFALKRWADVTTEDTVWDDGKLMYVQGVLIKGHSELGLREGESEFTMFDIDSESYYRDQVVYRRMLHERVPVVVGIMKDTFEVKPL